MSLTANQKRATAEELRRNYELLGVEESRVLADLRFTRAQLERTLRVAGADPAEVWKLRDYLVEKLRERGETPYPFSALADPAANRWFSYERTW